MKVVLTTDVKNRGRKGETIEVSDGFALNYLIPRKLGVREGSKKAVEIGSKKERQEGTKRAQTESLEQFVAAISDIRVEVARKANETGVLYDKMDEKELKELLAKETDMNVDELHIETALPLGEVGEHEIPVSYGNARGTFTFIISREA